MQQFEDDTRHSYRIAEGLVPREIFEQFHGMELLERVFTPLLEVIPDYAMILNEDRQVVAANSRMLRDFGRSGASAVVGRRTGEVLGCVFSDEGADGCGSGRHCAACGALHSILQCHSLNSQVAAECHATLNRENGASLDLEVLSTPLTIDGNHFTIFALKDVSAEKRRKLLEGVFFHDVLNTAGGIRGIATLLAQGNMLGPDKEKEYRQWMLELVEQLIEDITHQRKLVEAERGEFKPDLGVISVPDLLGDVYHLYAGHELAEGRQMVLTEVPELHILSDATILRRILGNMVKNALEATPVGGMVTIAASVSGSRVNFSVHNPGVMPEQVQLQLFQRSFSTKATGRGIGTYSMKLFGERYLKGKVYFDSREPDGTTFNLAIPCGY